MRRLGAAILVCVFAIGFTAAGSPSNAERTSDTVPSPASGEWWAAAQHEIAKSEYRITWARTILPDLRAAYQAPNRAHGLRTFFTTQGIRMVPRSATTAPEWEWQVRLHQYGYAGRLQPAAVARLIVDGHRAEYRRSGLTEWYVNDERGLEHGFTLAAPPSGGASQTGTIHLDLAVGGTLKPTWNAAEQMVELLTPSGVRVLQYGGLHAHDARGRAVPASMSVIGGASVVRIALDVAAAAFPITVDPVSLSPAWTAESNQAGAYFGYSVSTAGDVNRDGYSDLIVGAPLYDNGGVDAGQVFVYHGSPSGLGLSPAWTRTSLQAGAYFGWSVGTAGDVNSDGYSDVIIGAPLYDNGQTNEGVVWIYRGTSIGVTILSPVILERNQAGAQFGFAVAPAGDVNTDGNGDVIVGAPYFDNGQTDEGAAFVFHGSATSMSTSPAWTKESNQASANFGYAVATAGDANGDGFADVIIGAPNYDNGSSNEGMAFVYRGSSTGLGSSSFWSKDGDQAGAGFGWAVATAGVTIPCVNSGVVIGAPKYDNGQTNEGRIFVYCGTSSGMSLAWMSESNQAGAFFGSAVAPAGDVNGDGHSEVLVGAPQYDNGQTDEGRMFLIELTDFLAAPGAMLTPTWYVESNQDTAFMGWSVGPAGDVNGDGYADIVGSSTRYSNGQAQEGRAFVYYGRPRGVSFPWVRRPESGSETSALAGYAVASAGDVNGDGYGDVAIGAPWWDSGETDEGAVFIWYGRESGIGSGYNKLIQGGITGGRLGTALAGPGDTNGDGYDDLFMSQPGANAGKGYVRGAMGSASGITGLTWATGGTQVSEGFGTSISGAGDVNGDGYADLIVGAPYYDGSKTLVNEGRVYLYTGGQFGMGSNIIWSARGGQANGQFGFSVGSAGDVNRDGYSDVVIGAPFYDSGQINEGQASIYHGSASGPLSFPQARREINQASALFGYSVATAGDVNGDGYSDIIVGAHLYDSGQADEGGAFVFLGSSGGVGVLPSWTGQGDMSGVFFGWSVATAGDVNGDGYSDILIGVPRYDGQFTDMGRAVVYHGGPSGLPVYTANSGLLYGWIQTGAQFGFVVASAGDVNGDGYADVIVGQPWADTPSGVDAGVAFIWQGNSTSRRGNVPRQARVGNSTMIGPLGRSDSANTVRLIALARSPFGRTQAKLQWEVQPLGTPLTGVVGGTSPGGTAWQDTGANGIDISGFAGLSGGTGHHWQVRLRFRPSSSPFIQYTRWFTIPRNGLNEKDFRTP